MSQIIGVMIGSAVIFAGSLVYLTNTNMTDADRERLKDSFNMSGDVANTFKTTFGAVAKAGNISGIVSSLGVNAEAMASGFAKKLVDEREKSKKLAAQLEDAKEKEKEKAVAAAPTPPSPDARAAEELAAAKTQAAAEHDKAAKLSAELETARLARASVEKALEEKKAEIERLRSEAAAGAVAEAARFTVSSDVKRQHAADTEKLKKELAEKAEADKAALAKAKKDQEARIVELESELEKCKRDILRLEAQLAQEIEANVLNRTKLVNDIKLLNETLQNEKAVNEKELIKLKEEADKAREKASDQTKEAIAEREALMKELCDQLADAKKKFAVAALEKELLEHEKISLEANHKTSLERLQAEKDAVESRIKDLEQKNTYLSNAASAQEGTLNRVLEASATEKAKLEKKVNTLNTELGDSNRELAAEKAELEAKVSTLNTKLGDSNRELATARAELEDLDKQLKESNLAFAKTKAVLEANLLAVNTELTESKAALANAELKYNDEVDALKKQSEYLRSNIQELNMELANKATDSGAAKAALEQQLVDANAKLKANAASLHDLQATNAASILECTTKLASLNRELNLLKERDESIIDAYEKLADSNHPTDAGQLQAYIQTLNQAVGVLTDDDERKKAQALLSKASAYMKEKIDAFKNFKESVARLHAPINGDSTIYNIDEMAEIIDKFVSATTQKSSTEHPFQMVMDHFSPKQGGGGDTSDTDDITVNIATIKSSLDNFMRTPFKWRDNLATKYMYDVVIKLLSMPFESINSIECFTNYNVKQALALTVFWDATPLLTLLDTKDMNKLFSTERATLLKKSEVYATKLQMYKFNGDIKFLMTEDMIEFYSKLSTEYFNRNKQLNSKTFPLFVRAYQDYELWTQLAEKVFKPFIDTIRTCATQIDDNYKKTRDQVLTYLKVRCDTSDYNRYYNVYTQGAEPGNVLIAGPGPNIKIRFNKSTDRTRDEEYGLERNESGTVTAVNRYAYSYLYGPFTRTFGPKMNNMQVSVNCTEIMTAIKAGRDVLVIGYGASGAGKTSSLIYYDKGTIPQETDGALINICRNCGASNITLSVYELYGTEGGKFSTIEYKDIPIVLEQDKYVISSGTNREFSSGAKIENGFFSFESENPSYPYLKDKKVTQTNLLTGVIVSLVNTLRMVSTTPNNEQSSRSHVLVFLKMKLQVGEENKDVTLVIGDLAGVENTFACDELQTQIAFINKKKELDANSPSFMTTADIKEILKTKSKETYTKYIKYINKLTTIVNADDPTMYTTPKGKYEEANKLLSELETLCLYKSADSILSSSQEVLSDEEKKYNAAVEAITKLKTNSGVTGYPISSVDKNGLAAYIYFREDPGFTVYAAKNEISLESILTHSNGFRNQYLFNPDLTQPFDIPLLLERQPRGENMYKPKNLSKQPGVKLGYKNKKKEMVFFNLSSNIEAFEFNIPKTTKPSELNQVEGAYARDALKIDYAQAYLTYLKTQADEARNNRSNRVAGKFDKLRQKKINELFTNINALFETPTPTVQYLFASDNNIEQFKNHLTQLKLIYAQVAELVSNNENLLNQTKKECRARQTEGTFINNALKNMRREIVSVLNANRSDVLLGHIPVFNDSCFKYYCDPENDKCFNSLKVPSLRENHTSEILDQIRSVLGPIDDKKKLVVAIFGVLNISQVEANDPPKIPYIDLTDLKKYRDQYEKHRNTFCGDGHCIKGAESLDLQSLYDKISECVNGKGKDIVAYSEIITDTISNGNVVKAAAEHAKFVPDSVAYVLYMHQTDIGSGYFTQAMQCINALNKKRDATGNFYKEFISLLGALDDINGLSILGTIDFIHDMKNNSSTDVSCRLNFYPPVGSTDTDVSNLRGYKNIVTGAELSADPAFIIKPPKQSGGRPPHMFQYDAPLYLIKLCRLLAYRHSFHAYDVMPTPAILLKDVLVAFGVASVIMCLVTGAFDMRMFQYVVIDVSMSITLILLGLVVLTEKVADDPDPDRETRLRKLYLEYVQMVLLCPFYLILDI
jgi:hypothetical protein